MPQLDNRLIKADHFYNGLPMINRMIDYVVVTSDEPWCEIWHTQLHYAFQLSKRVKVVFLGPPNPWKVSNLWKIKHDSQRINDNLEVVTYLNVLPAGLGIISLWVNDHVNTLLLKNKMRDNLQGGRGIVWHFDPHRSFYLFRNNTNWKHLFHVIDPIAGCNLDLKLAAMASLVVVTSPKFVEHYKALNKNVLQIGQGVDIDFYNEPDINSENETSISKDSILLLGTITDQIHFKLLIKIAGRFPSKLVLIGPDKTQSESAKRLFKELIETPGVNWLGAMNPAGFRKHLKVCRVGIIAYDNTVNYKNDFRSPLKVISYLACGKSIISNIDCEIPSLVNEAIYEITNDSVFIDRIADSYNGILKFNTSAANTFLQTISYNHLLEQIFTGFDEQLPPLQ